MERKIHLSRRVRLVTALRPEMAPHATAIPQMPTAKLSTNVGATLPTIDMKNVESPESAERVSPSLAATMVAVMERLDQYEQRRSLHFDSWKQAAIDLAMAVATRLVHQKVADGQFPVDALVREMVAPLADNHELTVFLNPADLQALTEHLGDRPLFGDDRAICLMPDATLGRCDCRVESAEQVLLSQLSVRIRDMREEMIRSLADAA